MFIRGNPELKFGSNIQNHTYLLSILPKSARKLKIFHDYYLEYAEEGAEFWHEFQGKRLN